MTVLCTASTDTPLEYLCDLNGAILARSEDFYGYRTPLDFRLDGDWLKFTSPVATPHPSNNDAHARWFPAAGSKKAVVVLPHWNASLGQHQGLCRGIRKLGISALRISLPYHDYRMPPSSNAPTTPFPQMSPAPWTPRARP